MTSAERLLPLDVEVEELRLERAEIETAAGWRRVTTTVVLAGGGCEGRGEDVCYDPVEHDDFPTPDLSGSHTLARFSRLVAGLDLWPERPPEWKGSYDYRVWAFESAALDLALRQAGMTLGDALGREYAPVRFAVSGVSDPAVWLAIDDSLEFKLDVSASWDEPLMRNYAETGRVRVLDFKAYYEATQVESIDDPEEYALVVSIFPDAVLEDAALNDETRPVLAGALERLSFDAPIHSLADVHALGVSPQHLNIKPSRFGTIERLFDCVDWCLANDVSMYGGGQFELGIGREQIQAFASLFYPDAANDVAPGDYNTATEPRAGLAGNPLAVPETITGFSFSA